MPVDSIVPTPIDSAKLSDRELLLILHERVGTMGRDLHDLKNGTTQKIAALEARVDLLNEHKADREATAISIEKLADLKADRIATDLALEKLFNTDVSQTRQINRLNNYLWFGWGALAALQIIIGLLLKYGPPIR